MQDCDDQAEGSEHVWEARLHNKHKVLFYSLFAGSRQVQVPHWFYQVK